MKSNYQHTENANLIVSLGLSYNKQRQKYETSSYQSAAGKHYIKEVSLSDLIVIKENIGVGNIQTVINGSQIFISTVDGLDR